MARRKRSMRQIKRILELHHEKGLSIREISCSLGLPASTVGDYLRQAATAGLGWPVPAELSESELHERLRGTSATPTLQRPLPDYEQIREELSKKGVTRRLLWEEYRREHPDGYGLSQFCDLYRRWLGTIDPVLRQVHAPGEAMYVDWAGMGVPIRDPLSGVEGKASLFVAVLGYSNFVYAEAFADQCLGAWITGHIHAYEAFCGVPRRTVPDNPRTAVIRACRYEPEMNPTYNEMAEHYGTVIMPARVKRPRDKAKVETAVQIAERRILAALRDHTFLGLGDANGAIRQKLAELNVQPFQKLDGTRQSRLAEEQPHLRPLPAHRYDLSRWTNAKVNIDYHVAADNHFYSVPYQHVGATVEVRTTDSTVEIFRNGQRIAAHARSRKRGGFTTLAAHRPKAHQAHLDWSPSRLIHWAASVGPATREVVEHILQSKPHPEQGYRSCLGILRLAKGTGPERMEKASRRALRYGLCSYRQIKSILENRLEEEPQPSAPSQTAPEHPNLRGPGYYR